MSEMGAFELRVADTLLWYADDVPTTVDAAAVAHRAVLEHPRTRARRLALPWTLRPVPALAWLVILGLVITSLLAAALFVGSQRPAVVGFTCPSGSNPDEPGPVDQARPLGDPSAMAFDRRAGRLVAVMSAGKSVETWTFDVCTNTWTQMHPDREPPGFEWTRLAYDVDSDRTLLVSSGKMWAYHLQANTWTEKGPTPPFVDDIGVQLYDPVTGHVIAADTNELWSYDVETDTWTPIHEAESSDSGAIAGGGWRGYGALAYDASVDRIVAPGAGAGRSEGGTGFFDIRTGTWSGNDAIAPHVLDWWTDPAIAYDEAAERTVISGNVALAAYDATADRWETLFTFGPEYHGSAIMYDSVNERLVVFPDYWEEWTNGTRVGDVLAFDLASRDWTVLLEPIEGQPAP